MTRAATEPNGMPARVTVISVLGAGRSGSTILGDVLALLDGARNVGELRGIFEWTGKGSVAGCCTCGKEYFECAYWKHIFSEAWGASWNEDIQNLLLDQILPRTGRLVVRRLLSAGRNVSGIDTSTALASGMGAMQSLIRAIRDAGTRVVVDTSKASSFAWLLSRMPEVQVLGVQLIRDPRAVLHSARSRAIALPERRNPGSLVVRTRTGLESTTYWYRANIGAWLARPLGIPTLGIRHEDLIRDPVGTIDRIIVFASRAHVRLSLNDEGRDALRGRTVPLRDRHLVAGNPGVRAQRNMTQLRTDDRWVTEMSPSSRMFWTAVYLPALMWLRYPIWVGRAGLPGARDEV